MGNQSGNNKSNNSKSPEEVAIDLAIKGIGLAVTAVGAHVVGTVGHRISELRSRKKAKELSVEENNKEADKM